MTDSIRYITSAIAEPEYLANARGVVAFARGACNMAALSYPDNAEILAAQAQTMKASEMLQPLTGDWNMVSRADAEIAQSWAQAAQRFVFEHARQHRAARELAALRDRQAA